MDGAAGGGRADDFVRGTGLSDGGGGIGGGQRGRVIRGRSDCGNGARAGDVFGDG